MSSPRTPLRSGVHATAAALLLLALAAAPMAVVPEARATAMGFTASTVSPAVGLVQDLYEPTVTAAAHGAGTTLYVAGHVTGADSTGTPAYYDDGAGWKPLPVVSTVAVPSPGQGAAPPGGDEGTVVADGSGHAWLVDTEFSTEMSVQGFCNYGASACFYQPDAYHPTAATCGFGVSTLTTDRPWAAYAKVGSQDKLLLVNNGNLGTVGNVAQIGLLPVFPGGTIPVGVTPGDWNHCAGGGFVDGYIPGPPAMDSSGLFLVPQLQGISGSSPQLAIISGTAVNSVTTTNAFAVSPGHTLLACSSNYGFAAKSAGGSFFVTAATDSTHFSVAATTTGTSFKTTSFATTDPIAFLWISGSKASATDGALVSWAEDDGGSCNSVSFHAAHITLDASGNPQMADSTTIVSGTVPCGDLMGSDVGPDGNAYVVVFSSTGSCTDSPLSHPLTVYKQTSGPTL